jgi:transposase-like protein
VCPRCKGTERITALRGKSTRIGVRFCNPCRKPFTVKVGTVFESSHIPLRIWLQAIGLLCASKKGMSSNQLHRTLGITLKSAWFLSHRIREAMAGGDLAPMGGGGWIVEADETYFGSKDVVTKRTILGKPSHSSQRSVVALVERRRQSPFLPRRERGQGDRQHHRPAEHRPRGPAAHRREQAVRRRAGACRGA